MKKYLHFYNVKNKDYNKNGDYIVEILEGKITKEINGVYKATLLVDRTKLPPIINNNIIKIYDGTQKKTQLFIINNIVNNYNNLIEITAYHILVLLRNYYIKDFNIEQMNILNVIEKALKDSNSPFKLNKENSTQFTEIKDFIIDENNLLNFIVGDNNSIKDIYKQDIEIKVDNYEITIKDNKGENKGVLITDGKNLQDFKMNGDYSNIYTRIRPFTSKDIYLPEGHIDSEYIDNYPYIKELLLELNGKGYELEKVEPEHQNPEYNEELQALYERIRKECKRLFEEEKIDQPIYSYNVVVEDIINDKRYEPLQDLIRLNLRDTVKVKNNVNNINLDLKIVGIEWNITEDRSENITLDNLNKTFTSSINYDKKTITKGEGGDCDDLLGRVEDLEKGFSEIKQEYNNIKFKFGSSNINRIKNGAFNAGIKYWSVNKYDLNNKYLFTEKWNDKALNIMTKTKTEEPESNKAYIITDFIKLLKGELYTLSFKYLMNENTSSLIVKVLEADTEDEEWKESEFLRIDKEKGETKEDIKIFKDFTANKKYIRFKILHNGNSKDFNDYSSIIVSQFALYRGVGYKDYDYNDEIYKGITTIDEDGVMVWHKDIDTTTRMNAQGFHIVDGDNNVIGSMTSQNLNYTTLGVDYVIAGNVKTAIKNQTIRWNVGDIEKIDYKKRITPFLSYIFNDEYIIEKNRENSPLYIEFNSQYKNYDNIYIEGFTGSPIHIVLPIAGYIRGRLNIIDCTAPIIIEGRRRGLKDTDGGVIFGEVFVKNSSNVQLSNFSINGKKYKQNAGRRNSGLCIENSKVYITDLNINNYDYCIESYKSELWIKNVVGNPRYFLYGEHNNINLIEESGEINLADYSLDFMGFGNFINKGNYPIIRNSINQSQYDRELEYTVMVGEWSIDSDHQEWKAITYNKTLSKNITWEEAGRKVIGGLVKNRDYNPEVGNNNKYYEMIGMVQLKGTFIDRPENIQPFNTFLKVRLKPKTYINKKFKCYLSGFNNTISDEGIGSEPLNLVENLGYIGDLELIKYNYIKIPDNFIYLLVGGEMNGIAFTPLLEHSVLIKEEDKEKIDEPLYIEAGAVKLFSILKWKE